MRHYAGVKVILSILLFFAACAAADEVADRAAIGRTIAALNETTQRAALFTQDADSSRELDRLRKAKARAFPDFTAARPTVTISHEPWGEATIDLLGTLEILNPRIGSDVIRFITRDVALTDGVWKYGKDGRTHAAPLLFVMKKEAGNWKIASIRILLE